LIAAAICLRSLRTKVMSDASIAMSVPVPMAIPTSAAASAGASLIPSPTMATTRPSLQSLSTSFALSSGRTSAKTFSIPACFAMKSAVRRLSPVNITTSIPSFLSSRIASLDVSFSVSATPMMPAVFLSTATIMAVLP
jgi:hypothetical protein